MLSMSLGLLCFAHLVASICLLQLDGRALYQCTEDHRFYLLEFFSEFNILFHLQ